MPPSASATPLTLDPVALSCHLRISTRSPRFLGLLGWPPGGTIGKRAGQDLSECIGARDGSQLERGLANDSNQEWLSCSSARCTTQGDVAGCVPVGMLSEAARPATEPGLIHSVVPVHVPASRAGLRGVGGVNPDDHHSDPPRLVRDEAAELVESLRR